MYRGEEVATDPPPVVLLAPGPRNDDMGGKPDAMLS